MRNFDEVAKQLLEHADFEHGAGASADVISNAEFALDLVFPESYRRFLQDFGWCSVGSTEVFGLGADVPAWLDVVKMTTSERTEMHPPMPSNILPICNDGGGNHICIDTNQATGSEMSIVIWNHDLQPDQHPERLAESFADWVVSKL